MTILLYSLVYITSVIISSIAQILLKKSANKEYDNHLKEYLNLRVISAYSIFFLATFCTMIAYKGIPLKLGPILGATEYIFVTILSKFILHEEITRRKLLGLGLIVLGVIVFSL